MDIKQKNALRKCRVRLVNDLVVEELLDSVDTHGLFTSIMLEYIKSRDSRPEKVRVLLDNVARRGPDAFDKFLLCLRESGHGTAASYLIQEYEKEKGNGVARIKVEARVTTPAQGQTVASTPPNIYHTQESSSVQATQGQGTRSFQETQGRPGIAMETEAGDDDMDVNPSSGAIQESMPPGVREENLKSTEANKVMDSEQNSVQPSGTRPGPIQTSLSRSVSSNSVSLSPGYTGNLTEEYKMESDPRGLLLIINNRDFDCDMGNRDGTDVDCDALRKLFLNLGFGVDVRHNLSAMEMVANLLILSRLDQLYDVDCLTVAILTHGSEDKLYGVDGQYCMIKDLTEPFSSQFCPALHNKPKFFIFNACRGGTEDKGTPSFRLGQLDLEDNECFSDVSQLKPTSSSIKIPSMQDFLLAYSTIPGYVSWRHMNDGSWFIQVLTKVFEEQASRKHVVDMLVTVNRKVAEIVNGKGVQIPAPSVMLTKNWYLNPNLQY